MNQFLCLLIGYLFGNILTAEIVARKYAGKSAFAIGTSHNPGMANIMAHVGFVPGLLVLAGDLAKVAAADLVCWFFFSGTLGRSALIFAGTGATIGHDFPFWHHFRGGKGVASSCLAIFLYAPLAGVLANIAGMLAVFATQYLCVGGVVIPLVFTILSAFFCGRTAVACGILLTALAFLKHGPALLQAFRGTGEKTNVPGAIRKLLSSRDKK